MNKSSHRCAWVPVDDELYTAYHDEEWGEPCHDENKLFEMLCLEGAQAGLSWITILRRRQSYRKAFDNFDAKLMVAYGADKQEELLQDTGIIRNRLKVAAFIDNARSYLSLVESGQTFEEYVWGFVDGEPLIRPGLELGMMVATTMSKDLKQRSFRFVGPTICYAFMQATGMVNDHEAECWKFQEHA